jgi:hypothetical protein
MSRYVRLPSDNTPPLPPPSAFLHALFFYKSTGTSAASADDDDDENDDYENENENENNNNSNSNNNNNNNNSNKSMLTSLKESASIAAGGLRENMTKASGSVRAGLGMPAATGREDAAGGGAEDNSDAESQASRMLEEVSEYCPKMTYQQVS